MRTPANKGTTPPATSAKMAATIGIAFRSTLLADENGSIAFDGLVIFVETLPPLAVDVVVSRSVPVTLHKFAFGAAVVVAALVVAIVVEVVVVSLVVVDAEGSAVAAAVVIVFELE